MYIPLTFVTTLIGSVVMLGAWVYIGYRADKVHAVAARPVQLFRQFFLNLGLFLTFLWISHLWLTFDPANFPLAAAIGYVVGHVFLYIGFTSIARMTCVLIPKLASKERLITVTTLSLAAVVTVINAVTMIFGTRPSFDYINNVTLFNASPIVGASIGLYGLITMVPAIILFMMNAIKASGTKRVRSGLLAIGLFALVLAGPLHDLARTSQVYVFADVLTIISMIIIGTGVAYRLEESLAPAVVSEPVIIPSSNTV
jgi:hypothetical protein